ncbi:hypothetical protein IGS68_21175 [Skermanella sp. TT6]|uniref:Uncharacterized protein n=1 Tax=Skermanella cutis TaxID=2775420 RepID=A0ABX7B2H6_9PROT|nr:hypothetical protein [Skermanella sp. TT6]QQP88524.1 hypothetical protein IGS68_21175 [Skermanella sp. TT6]
MLTRFRVARPLFRPIALSLGLSALAVGVAAATVVKEGGPQLGAKPGGSASVAPDGAVRLQCWQQGSRIIDEGDLRDAAVGYFEGAGSLRFRRGSAPGRMVMLLSPAPETTCLLIEDGE